MTTQVASNLIANSVILFLLFVAIVVVINILILKFITWVVTNTVLDVLEKRGYGKGFWKR